MEGTSNDAAATFETATAHIPSEVSGGEPQQSQALPAPEQIGWTPALVADQFRGVFALLSVLRHPLKHWDIPDEKILHLGAAWTPIFIRWVPFGAEAAWLSDLMMWIGAIGALKEVAGAAIVAELQLLKASREKQQRGRAPSSPASTQTDSSGESSSLPESGAPENLGSSSESSATVEHAF
jgi:hypothetical protein